MLRNKARRGLARVRIGAGAAGADVAATTEGGYLTAPPSPPAYLAGAHTPARVGPTPQWGRGCVGTLKDGEKCA